jgi:hypothetical protein
MAELTLKTTLAEFDDILLAKLKDLFAGDAIVQINITNVPDETDYLLSTRNNRASLERSIEQFRQGKLIQKEELAL